MDKFQHYEQCDGNGCGMKKLCARYMGNNEIEVAANLYINFVKTMLPFGCPYILPMPAKGYQLPLKQKRKRNKTT